MNNIVSFDVFLSSSIEPILREKFSNLLVKKLNTKIKVYNSIVTEWSLAAVDLENFMKLHTTHHVYILSPKMLDIYIIAEMVDSVHDKSKKVYFCILDDTSEEIPWTEDAKKSLDIITILLLAHGAYQSNTIEELAIKVAEEYSKIPVLRSRSDFQINDNT